MSLNTDKAANVSEAISTRITVRDFLDTPVPDAMLREIFEKALRSPSGGNLQPWNLHIMTGDTLAAFKKRAIERTLAGKTEEPTHPAYPSPLWEPQRSWRFKLGEDMYKLLGIPREDKAGRLKWFAQNADFFNAPVGIIITGKKQLNMPQHMDIGIFLQTIMLLAREAGLHTAPQGWWRNWTSVSDELLNIPNDQEVLVGMAIGYGNPETPVNSLYADRAELQEVAKFYD